MASFFGTLFDLLIGEEKIPSAAQVGNNALKNNFSSIAAKASEGILQFPVVISNAVDFDAAVTTGKALERSYASFVEVVFSMNKDLGDVNTDNISDYLHSFHQNTDTTTDTSSFFEESLKPDKPLGFKDEKTETTFECQLYYPEKPLMVGVLKEQLKPYIENFCLTKLNDLYTPRRISETSYRVNMEGYITEKKVPEKAVVTEDMLRNTTPFGTADVKKANELQPTFIVLRVEKRLKGQVTPIVYNVTVGIKTTLHPVSSKEFISNLVDACEYKGTLFRFIKWTTGEIGFIRDFVLRMDQFSKETARRANKDSSWWNALRNRARQAKISKVQSNRLLPNATLVFSKDEADYIKANYGYDLLSFNLASRIMKEYFLLGYIILDSSTETAYILYDGQTKFQATSFKALERENSNAERQFKEILRATKKM